MNDKQLKTLLKHAYEAPEPREESPFLLNVRHEEVSILGFIASQARFLRMKSWAVSALMVTAIAIAFNCVGILEAWHIAAIMPVAALVLVNRLTKSLRFGVEELEQTARFSRSQLIMARMLILGLGNLAFMMALMPAATNFGSEDIVRAACLMLCPFCISAALSFEVFRHWRDPESIYACLGISAIASIAVVFACSGHLSIVIDSGFSLTIATITAIAFLALECRNFCKVPKEIAWN